MTATPAWTTLKPTSLPNGHGGTGRSGGKSPTPGPAGAINHVAIDDERMLRDRYEFGDQLGAGSFGVVWLVTHLGSGQQYACKIIIKEKVTFTFRQWRL